MAAATWNNDTKEPKMSEAETQQRMDVTGEVVKMRIRCRKMNTEDVTCISYLEEPQTLMSSLSLNHLKKEEHPSTSGNHGPPTPPEELRNTEEELEKMSLLLESNIEALRLLIVKVYQYSKCPTQDVPCRTRKKRSLKELENEFLLKMEQLKQAVADFSVDDLYYLILHIKNDDWIHLMRLLRLSESEMEACSRLYPNLREQKYQMLKIWLSKAKDGMRTHRDQLVGALVFIEYENLAARFRRGPYRNTCYTICMVTLEIQDVYGQRLEKCKNVKPMITSKYQKIFGY